MNVEIIGPDGKVHYRRHHEHPDVLEALRTPGYSVRGYLESPPHPGPSADDIEILALERHKAYENMKSIGLYPASTLHSESYARAQTAFAEADRKFNEAICAPQKTEFDQLTAEHDLARTAFFEADRRFNEALKGKA
jgi:hypothetical protein